MQIEECFEVGAVVGVNASLGYSCWHWFYLDKIGQYENHYILELNAIFICVTFRVGTYVGFGSREPKTFSPIYNIHVQDKALFSGIKSPFLSASIHIKLNEQALNAITIDVRILA